MSWTLRTSAQQMHRNWHSDVERLVPPKKIHKCVQESQGNGEELKLGDLQALDGSCDALKHEPCCLSDDKGFGECVGFAAILDFLLSDGRKLDLALAEEFLKLPWRKDSLRSFALVQHEAAHLDEIAMRLGPSLDCTRQISMIR